MSDVQTTIKAATSEANGPACFNFNSFYHYLYILYNEINHNTNFSRIKLKRKRHNIFSRLFLFSQIGFFLILILCIRDPVFEKKKKKFWKLLGIPTMDLIF